MKHDNLKEITLVLRSAGLSVSQCGDIILKLRAAGFVVARIPKPREPDISPVSFPDSAKLDDMQRYLSIRAYRVCVNNGFKTAGDVRRAQDSELLRLPNFGKRTLRELRSTLGPCI